MTFGMRVSSAMICCVRSATFILGLLQGLARHGLLEQFDYLSTVSGGGFSGGWLSAWIHRAEGGLRSVATQLARPRDKSRPNPEPVEIQNLRSYSNYLTPRTGLMSGDTWAVIATYVVVVVFAERDNDTIRIISLRKALKHERLKFEEAIRNGLGEN